MRTKHHAWGGRKIRRRLEDLGYTDLPAPSTITDILRRHGLMDASDEAPHRPFLRFEHEHPNDLWQMDFKGQFRLVRGGWCFPLTVLDDHSRFALGLRACGDQKDSTVQDRLTDIFRRYGLPARIITDNGSPWGCDETHKFTRFSTWLIRLGISVSHGRPRHPQTQGKDERFHRTLKVEVLREQSFRDNEHAQTHFDRWRDVYNLERPHDALGLATPASRYQPSHRPFPECLPAIEYGPGDVIRKVNKDGYFTYQGRTCKISQAFRGHPVALRPTTTDGLLDVFFCHQKVAQIDLRNHTGD